MTATHKDQFNDAVTEIIEAHVEPRERRIRDVNELIDEYITSVGEVPCIRQLERLTDYIMHEEINNTDPDKMTKNEYPIMSGRQEERRHNNETSLRDAEHVGTDGRDYRRMVRRRRTIGELIFVDKHAKIRNRKRRRAYEAFVRGGNLVTEIYRVDTIKRYLRMKYGIK